MYRRHWRPDEIAMVWESPHRRGDVPQLINARFYTLNNFWNLPTGVGMYRSYSSSTSHYFNENLPTGVGMYRTVVLITVTDNAMKSPHRRGDVPNASSWYIIAPLVQSPHRRGDVPLTWPNARQSRIVNLPTGVGMYRLSEFSNLCDMIAGNLPTGVGMYRLANVGRREPGHQEISPQAWGCTVKGPDIGG